MSSQKIRRLYRTRLGVIGMVWYGKCRFI